MHRNGLVVGVDYDYVELATFSHGKGAIANGKRASTNDGHGSQVRKMQLKRRCGRVMLVSVETNVDSEIDESMDHPLVHVVICPWSAYDTMVPHGNGYRDFRARQQRLRRAQHRGINLPNVAEAVIAVPRCESYDHEPKVCKFGEYKISVNVR